MANFNIYYLFILTYVPLLANIVISMMNYHKPTEDLQRSIAGVSILLVIASITKDWFLYIFFNNDTDDIDSVETTNSV